MWLTDVYDGEDNMGTALLNSWAQPIDLFDNMLNANKMILRWSPFSLYDVHITATETNDLCLLLYSEVSDTDNISHFS
jgi:hypothetical protein